MKLIKTSEAARLMGVTRQAIYYLIKTEKIYFYLVGKRIYIPESELDNLLDTLMIADGIDSELAADFIDTHKDMDKEPWKVESYNQLLKVKKVVSLLLAQFKHNQMKVHT